MKKGLGHFVRRALLTCFLAGIIFLAFIMASLPDIDSFSYTPAAKSEIYSADGVLIGEITAQNSTYVGKDDIPQTLFDAVVAVEDKRFYRHCGIDIIGIGRALVENIKAGEIVQGGSTITQQVAKILFFSTKQSYIRKLREAICAIKMTAKYTDKRDILTIYLNEIYLGGGAYGVYEASQTYFSKEPMELSLSQCALIAGIIQAPSAYCPLSESGYGYAVERRDKVLTLMAQQGYISEEEAAAAKAEEVVVTPSDESTFAHGVCEVGYESYLNRLYEQCMETIADYYVRTLNYSEAQAQSEAAAALSTQSLTINATINAGLQEDCLDAMDDELSEHDDSADCSFIFTDTESGNVLAYYGSDENIDMNKHARAPGSTIKPLYMAYLLENGIADRNTIVLDERFDVNGYSPANHNGEYYGDVTLRETLVHSLNAASLRLFLMGDTQKQIDYVKSLGISTIQEADYTAAFALGGMSEGIKPSEMVLAYGAIQNGGYLYKINYLSSVVSSDGVIIFAPEQTPKKVMSEHTAAEIASCLQSTVLRGTATPAQTGYSGIGKTGTTDDEHDVWFCGATGNTAASIWIGNVDYASVPSLSSSWCSRIYRQSLKAAFSDGAIDSSGLSPPAEETLITITVAKAEFENISELTEGDVATIEIPDYERLNFAGREVVTAQVCSVTGRLWNERSCTEEELRTAYFAQGQTPKRKCSRIYHIIAGIREGKQ